MGQSSRRKRRERATGAGGALRYDNAAPRRGPWRIAGPLLVGLLFLLGIGAVAVLALPPWLVVPLVLGGIYGPVLLYVFHYATASAPFVELDDEVLWYHIASPRGPQFRQLANREVSLHRQTSGHLVLRFGGGRRYWFPRCYRRGDEAFELMVTEGRLHMVRRHS